MMALATAETPCVVTVKVVPLAPAETVTFFGTTAAALFEARVIVSPLAGAAPLRVSMPEEELPPMTLLGDTERFVSVAAVNVKGADLLFVPTEALMVTVSVLLTPAVPMENDTEVAPEAMLTDAGTLASELLEDNVTVAPEVPAA